MIKIAGEANPPLHLFLGSDAYQMAKAKIADVQFDTATFFINLVLSH
jgi:hypothetical protein